MSIGGQIYVTQLGGCIAPFYVGEQYLGDPEHRALFSVS